MRVYAAYFKKKPLGPVETSVTLSVELSVNCLLGQIWILIQSWI